MTQTPSTPSSIAPPVSSGSSRCRVDERARGRARRRRRGSRAWRRSPGRGCRTRRRSVPSRDLRATLPVKPSVTITSTLPSSRSRPSTLPTKSTPTPAARSSVTPPWRAGCPSWTPPRSTTGRPSGAERAEAAGHEGRPHLRELDQPLGVAVGVGAGVDEDRGPARSRPGSGRRSPGGRRPAAGPCATGRSPSRRRCCPRSPSRRPGRRARPRRHRTRLESFFVRTLCAGSSCIAMTSPAGSTSRSAGVAERAVGRADEHDGDPELLGRAPCAGDDLAGGVVTAHGVDGDRQCRSTGERRPLGCRGRRHDGQSTSTAWRPLYHPQWGQTTCGSFARLHWGQRLREGSSASRPRLAGSGSSTSRSSSWGRPSSLSPLGYRLRGAPSPDKRGPPSGRSSPCRYRSRGCGSRRSSGQSPRQSGPHSGASGSSRIQASWASGSRSSQSAVIA